jgi:hypothetical protein
MVGPKEQYADTGVDGQHDVGVGTSKAALHVIDVRAMRDGIGIKER